MDFDRLSERYRVGLCSDSRSKSSVYLRLIIIIIIIEVLVRLLFARLRVNTSSI